MNKQLKDKQLEDFKERVRELARDTLLFPCERAEAYNSLMLEAFVAQADDALITGAYRQQRDPDFFGTGLADMVSGKGVAKFHRGGKS